MSVRRSSRFEILSPDNEDENAKLDQENQVETLRSENESLKEQLQNMSNSMENLTKMIQKVISRNEPLTTEEFSPKLVANSTIDDSVPIILKSQDILLNETARYIKDASTTEKEAPMLSSIHEDGWRKFRCEYILYTQKGGMQPLYKRIDEETRIFYQDQIVEKINSMDSQELFETIDALNMTVLDSTSILRTNLKMDKCDTYDKKKLNTYLNSFLILCQRYPQIEKDLEPDAILRIFFGKLSPKEICEDMFLLNCKTVKKGTDALRKHMQVKDVQLAANIRDGLVKNASTFVNSNNSNGTNPKICLNCKHNNSSDVKSNHQLWYCKDIETCYLCKKKNKPFKHLAYGSSCPHKDVKLFDYEKYLDIKIKKQDKSNIPNNYKNGNGKTNYANNVQQNNIQQNHNQQNINQQNNYLPSCQANNIQGVSNNDSLLAVMSK